MKFARGLPFLLCAARLAAAADGDGFAVRWRADSDRTNQLMVEVSGISRESLGELRRARWSSEKWQQLLAVYAEQGDLTTDLWLPSMSGSYQVESNSFRFKPQFALEPGVSYRAVFRPDQLPGGRTGKGKPISALWKIVKDPSEATTVVRKVYPTADIVPENLLKFYIYFSAPMSRGDIYDHIHLREASGKPVELPFLEINEELWDPSMTRLTVFIDPGRIKRGVKPLEEVGPALETGKSYVLAVDSAWRDAVGNPLKSDFQKSFKVGPADRDPPNPATWKIQPPNPRTANALEVLFPEPLDQALAQRMIRVGDDSDRLVKGTAQLGAYERTFHFVPDKPWQPGHYNLVIQNTIEDLAGNNIGKAFEVDLFERVERRFTNGTVKVPFEIR